MKTRSKLCQKTISAVPSSKHELSRLKSDARKKLKIAGIKTDEKMKVIPGLNQGSGHRAVFMKCLEKNKCVFKIDLRIASSDKYIAKTFDCPNVSCNFQNKTYEELANHHLTCHRGQGGIIKQTCCGEVFPFFELFCEHVYNCHLRQSISTIRPYFDTIREEKLDEYLVQHNIRFLDSFETEVTFNDLLDLGCQIVLSFERYWIFMWNCQDFAVWYLYNLGIPLKVLEPTISDRITGSNKDSNARIVQEFKGWAWYKQPEQLMKFSSISVQARYSCNKCEFLPPLSIAALNIHDQFAHNKENTYHCDPDQVNETEVCHYLRGAGKGFSLLTEPTRKWNVYRLRGSSTTAHASVVLCPWIIKQTGKKAMSIRPSEIFVCVGKRLDYRAMPYLYVNDMDSKYKTKLKKCGEIGVSIPELVDYISLVYDCMMHKGMVQTCVKYVYYLLNVVFKYKVAELQDFVFKSAYIYHRTQMRQSIYRNIEYIIDNEKYTDDISSIVGSNTLTLQGRVAEIGTSLHGKYQAMLPLHMMFMVTLLYFPTIGELILPLMILFTGYLMYSVVLSQYQIICKRWLVLKSWNVETTLRLIQVMVHVLSMTFLLVEVYFDLSKLHSMILLQMVWLNFMFLSREVGKKGTLTTRRYPGRLKPSVSRLLRINLSEDFFRMCVIITFLMPVCLIRIFIFVNFLSVVVCSRILPQWFRLKYFTGNDNLVFHLLLFTFLLIMGGFLLYTGDVIKPDASIASTHIIFFVIYFSISFWINSKEALEKIHYVQGIGIYYEGLFTLCTQGNGKYTNIYLAILYKIGIITLVLPIFGLIFLFSTTFETILIYLSLVLYTHFLSVYTAFDVKDIILTQMDEAIEKGSPTSLDLLLY